MNKGIIRFSMAALTAISVILSGCSKKESAPEEAPAEEAAAPNAAQPQAAPAEAATPAMMESAKSAIADGTEEVKQMAAETENVAAAAAEEREAEAAAVQEQQVNAMKEKAAGLVEQYAPQLEMLKTGTTSIKALIDKNASMLPAGVSEKYEELNALLPQLTELVGSLKNFQGTDLANLATKAQTDFAKARTLYAEIKGLLPAGSI